MGSAELPSSKGSFLTSSSSGDPESRDAPYGHTAFAHLVHLLVFLLHLLPQMAARCLVPLPDVVATQSAHPAAFRQEHTTISSSGSRFVLDIAPAGQLVTGWRPRRAQLLYTNCCTRCQGPGNDSSYSQVPMLM